MSVKRSRPEPDGAGSVFARLRNHGNGVSCGIGLLAAGNPPLTLITESPEAEKLIEEEVNLLEGLRGAYYLVLRPSLPLSFAWSDMWYGDYLDLSDPEYRRRFYSPERARDEMEEIEGKLGKLAERSHPLMPEYAERRMNQATTVQRIAALLGYHRRQRPT